MQEVFVERLSGIESKVKQLARKMGQLQKLNLALEEENRKLKSSLAVLKQKQRQATVPIISGADSDSQGAEKRSKKLKKEIDQYIKEIDKCIDWLQNN